ncbi:MAG: hypothetical protein ACLR4Z_03525 [Butyricicoccaceae bacterium]
MPTRSCSSATTSPMLPEDSTTPCSGSQRGNLSDAELRQKKMVTPFFIWANYDIEDADKHADQRELPVCVSRSNALRCSTSGSDQMRLATRSSRFR